MSENDWTFQHDDGSRRRVPPTPAQALLKKLEGVLDETEVRLLSIELEILETFRADREELDAFRAANKNRWSGKLPGDFDLTADARALWSVRVLDKWALAGLPITRQCCPLPYLDAGSARWRCAPIENGCYLDTEKHWHTADTPDAARLAAARAVWPDLPADVRAELGECP
jgi:hypothetical protein